MTVAELEQLREIVGREHVQGEGLAREYHIDGRVPRAVVEPRDLLEAQSVLVLAAGHGWGVVPWGGGTQMSLGAPPSRYDLAVTTGRMHDVLDYQPDDMTVTVQGGIILDNLARTLRERGQFLPLDPPLPQRATAGGTVASAASGPLRAGYGTPRDYLIGAAVAGSDGRAVRPGGKVVKNVAGYDLCKLYTGSFGTLGVLSELTFKVLPRPKEWAYSVVTMETAEVAEELFGRLMDSDTAPAALEMVNAGCWETCAGTSIAPHRFAAVALFAGEEEAVAWQQASAAAIAETCGLSAHAAPALQADVWFRALRDYPARQGLVLRISVRSSDVAVMCAEAEEIAASWEERIGIVAHVASGTVYARFFDPEQDVLTELVMGVRERAELRGGAAVVCRVPASFTGAINRWGKTPPGLRLMEGIKQALDPGGIMSVGRFAGGL